MPVTAPISGAPLGSASDTFRGQIDSSALSSIPQDLGVPGLGGKTFGGLISQVLPFVGPAASLFGSIFSAISSKREQRRREQMYERWRNNERAYNTPAMQIARLNAAGLNGKLILSQQGLTQGQSVPMPSALSSAPGAMLSDGLVSASQQLLQTRLAAAQIENVEAQTANVNAQTAKTRSETNLLPEQFRGLKMSNDTYSATQSNVIAMSRIDKFKALAERRLVEANASLAEIQEDITAKLGYQNAQWNFKILDQQYNKIKQDIVNAIKEGKNLDRQGALMLVERRLKQVELDNSIRFTPSDLRRLREIFVDRASADLSLTRARATSVEFDNRIHPGNPDLPEFNSFAASAFYYIPRFLNLLSSGGDNKNPVSVMSLLRLLK